MNILPAWYEDDERYLTYQLAQLPPKTDALIAGVKVRKIARHDGHKPQHYIVWCGSQRLTLFSAKAVARLICTVEQERAS